MGSFFIAPHVHELRHTSFHYNIFQYVFCNVLIVGANHAIGNLQQIGMGILHRQPKAGTAQVIGIVGAIANSDGLLGIHPQFFGQRQKSHALARPRGIDL